MLLQLKQHQLAYWSGRRDRSPTRLATTAELEILMATSSSLVTDNLSAREHQSSGILSKGQAIAKEDYCLASLYTSLGVSNDDFALSIRSVFKTPRFFLHFTRLSLC